MALAHCGMFVLTPFLTRRSYHGAALLWTMFNDYNYIEGLRRSLLDLYTIAFIHGPVVYQPKVSS
jgi:hypothetical protein